ncbi:hypothetical protein QAD02_014837 [Eretmocerus hayati]|uniref:Uncharacterized protein n=1 Tax=Eretmocerus hayati TaxID=131215 RepID=A0ACC2PBB2_9HYME|nr:hypothetical protein QAD02_014837 [Eretmocerus hayati]
MWALVLWTFLDPPQSSIVNSRYLRQKKTAARASDGKVYPVKVVAEDNDKDYLTSLHVSTEGEIMVETSNNEELLSNKREIAREKRQATKCLNTAMENIDKNLTGRSIFDDEAGSEDEGGSSPSPALQPKKTRQSQQKCPANDSNGSSMGGCYFCNIYSEGFVNTYVTKKKALSLQEFKRCITLHCGAMKSKYGKDGSKKSATKVEESNKKKGKMSHSTPKKDTVSADESQSDDLEESPHHQSVVQSRKKDRKGTTQKDLPENRELNRINQSSLPISKDTQHQSNSDSDVSIMSDTYSRVSTQNDEETRMNMISDGKSYSESKDEREKLGKNERGDSECAAAVLNSVGLKDKNSPKKVVRLVASLDSSKTQVSQESKRPSLFCRVNEEIERVSEKEMQSIYKEKTLDETQTENSPIREKNRRNYENNIKSSTEERGGSLKLRRKEDGVRDSSIPSVDEKTLMSGTKKRSSSREISISRNREKESKSRHSHGTDDKDDKRSRSSDRRDKKSPKRKHRSRSGKKHSKKSRKDRSHERHHHKSKRHRSRSRSSSRRRD